MNRPQNRPLQGKRVEGLNAAAGLLRSKTNRYAWYGLSIALLAIAAASVLAARAAYGEASWDTIWRAHTQNPAL